MRGAIYNSLPCLDGVVGYHASLTHWRSPVRVRVQTFWFTRCVNQFAVVSSSCSQLPFPQAVIVPSMPSMTPGTARSASAVFGKQDAFLQRKSAALASLSSELPDKSPKGGLDAPIADLVADVNRHPDLYTTSSCSGRISMLLEPLTTANGGEREKMSKKARVSVLSNMGRSRDDHGERTVGGERYSLLHQRPRIFFLNVTSRQQMKRKSRCTPRVQGLRQCHTAMPTVSC